MHEFLEMAPGEWHITLPSSNIPNDGAEFREAFTLSLSAPVNYWSQVYKPERDLSVEVSAARADKGVLLTISVETAVSLPCYRCLEPAMADVNGQLEYLVLKENEDSERDKEIDEDMELEILNVESWDETIDLAPLVWEVLVTSLPVRAFCKPDCKGLCPQCGANLNKTECACKKQATDPRFEVLRTLVEKK